MCSECDDAALPAPGSPIRESTGHRPFNASPWLIAVVHALHRLLVPRHPPCALTILTVINSFSSVPSDRTDGPKRCPALLLANLCGFQGPARSPRPGTPSGRSLKTQQRAGWCPSLRLGRHARSAGRPRRTGTTGSQRELPRKEVIQPHLPVRLPCYDFTPITSPTFDGSLPLAGVGSPASGVARFRGVTGGVYKARERIHRGIADPRLLATPPSWRRVSASNPNRDRLFGIRSTSRSCSPLYRPM
jgi:hypothetical protein